MLTPCSLWRLLINWAPEDQEWSLLPTNCNSLSQCSNFLRRLWFLTEPFSFLKCFLILHSTRCLRITLGSRQDRGMIPLYGSAKLRPTDGKEISSWSSRRNKRANKTPWPLLPGLEFFHQKHAWSATAAQASQSSPQEPSKPSAICSPSPWVIML